MRSFIGIPVPSALREAIACAVGKQRTLVDNVRWVEKENIHVTLKFLGDCAPDQLETLSKQVQLVAAKMDPFPLIPAGVAVFPHLRMPRVVVIECGGDLPAVKRLATEIESCARSVGVPPERRDFRAHLTIGRVRERSAGRGMASFLAAMRGGGWGEMTVDGFNLYESTPTPQGSRYRVIRSFHLGGAIS